MRFKSDNFEVFKGLVTPDDSADLSTGNVFCEQELPPGLVTCKNKIISVSTNNLTTI